MLFRIKKKRIKVNQTAHVLSVKQKDGHDKHVVIKFDCKGYATKAIKTLRAHIKILVL